MNDEVKKSREELIEKIMQLVERATDEQITEAIKAVMEINTSNLHKGETICF